MSKNDQVRTQIDYQTLFSKAYQLMDEPIIEGNCGELCGYHCCRRQEKTGERLGMYLLPLECEYMQSGKVTDYEIHSCLIYDMPPKIKKMIYIFCHESEGCLRNLRPVQCRTYPFEPHLDENGFSLVIEKDQIHACPLLNRIPEWRPAFIEGIYNGWLELLNIPIIKYHILYFSEERNELENISKRYTDKGWT